jgi:hypothetical protein
MAAKSTKKTATAKKTTRGKSVENALTTAAQGAREDFLEELMEIARDLDEVSLGVLKHQAAMLRARGKIKDFSQNMNVAVEEATRRRRQAARPAFDVRIEHNEDDFFIIQLDDVRVFFNRSEMRELTRIAHAAADRAGGAKRLFRWFEKERQDLLNDAGIAQAGNPYLLNLYDLIITTYKVKDS